MSKIFVEPDHKSLEIKSKTTILKATLKAGIAHQHACGGRGKCTTCRVRILEGLENCKPRTPRENRIASLMHFSENTRLACQTIVTDDVKIRRLVIDEIDLELTRSKKQQKKVSRIGEEINATLVFMDIFDFTAFTSVNQPYDVVHILNRYYYLAGKAVHQFQGRILDYYGDGILAIFGFDSPQHHTQQALNACKKIFQDIEKLSSYVNVITPHPFRLRIGIHSGNVIVGTMGMMGFEKLAVVGDVVNIASRIENANKDLDTQLLISNEAIQLLNGEVKISQTHKLNIKGKKEPILVHEIVC